MKLFLLILIISLYSCTKDIEPQKKMGVFGYDVRYTNKWVPIDSTVTHWCVQDQRELERFNRNDTLCDFRIFKWRIGACNHNN